MRTRSLAAIAAFALNVGCYAHTRIVAQEKDPCGEFSSLSVGVPAFYTPAGQYATYRGACAQYETVRTLASMRAATVDAAVAAAGAVRGGARDDVAREGLIVLALKVECTEGDAEACDELAEAMRGGAR